MTNYRWAITSLLFFSVAINYNGPAGALTYLEGFYCT
jgi:hypothetical protein